MKKLILILGMLLGGCAVYDNYPGYRTYYPVYYPTYSHYHRPHHKPHYGIRISEPHHGDRISPRNSGR